MEHRPWVPTTPDARELLLCFNPSAGSGSRHGQVAAIEAELVRSGYQVRSTSDLAEIQELASRMYEKGNLRAALACGGDGTASLIRNRVPLEVPLLPIPTGTECLLGRYLGQDTEPMTVRDTLDHGVVINLDLGRANNGRGQSQYFLMMISVGFDAAVARQLHLGRRGNIRRLSYLQPILRTIRSYEYPEIQLYCDHDPREIDPKQNGEPVRCRWLFGFNLPLYALGWQLAPQASGTDGRLDVCTFERGSLIDGVRYLWHVLRRSHHRLADSELTCGKRFRIEAAGGGEVPYQIDGDFTGFLPVEVEVIPSALRLLVRPEVAEKLGFTKPEV
jgi:diacylglycerol kinase family enzyme